MKKLPFLPPGDLDREKWLLNFDVEFAGIAIVLGFTTAEASSVHNDYLAYSYVLSINTVLKSELQERNRFKDLLADGDIGSVLINYPAMPVFSAPPTSAPVSGIFKRMSKIVQRIKNHPNYNEAIGKNLGIIGAERVINFGNIKAEGQVKNVTTEFVELSFTKGETDGVVAFEGIPAQASTNPDNKSNDFIWVEIGQAKSSPFVDYRCNKTQGPETRYYKFRHIKDDHLIGHDSDIIRVIVDIRSTQTSANTTNNA